jgi:hypothetical protein
MSDVEMFRSLVCAWIDCKSDCSLIVGMKNCRSCDDVSEPRPVYEPWLAIAENQHHRKNAKTEAVQRNHNYATRNRATAAGPYLTGGTVAVGGVTRGCRACAFMTCKSRARAKRKG